MTLAKLQEMSGAAKLWYHYQVSNGAGFVSVIAYQKLNQTSLRTVLLMFKGLRNTFICRTQNVIVKLHFGCFL